MMPDDGNCQRQVADFGLDPANNGDDIARRARQRVQQRIRRPSQGDGRCERTAKARLIDTRKVAGFRHSAGNNGCRFDNRRVVTPGDRDRHGHHVRRIMFVRDRCNERVCRRYAFGQRLRRGKLVIQLIGPFSRHRVQFERAERSCVGIDRPGQNRAIVDVRRHKRSGCFGNIGIVLIEGSLSRVGRALIATEDRPGPKVRVHTVDQARQLVQQDRIRSEPRVQRRIVQIAQKVVMHRLHAIGIASRIAAIGREFRRYVDQRHAAGFQILCVDNAEPHKGFVDLRNLNRGRADIGAIEMMPDDGNCQRQVADLGLDPADNSDDITRRARQRVQQRIRRTRKSDGRHERTAQARLIDI